MSEMQAVERPAPDSAAYFAEVLSRCWRKRVRVARVEPVPGRPGARAACRLLRVWTAEVEGPQALLVVGKRCTGVEARFYESLAPELAGTVPDVYDVRWESGCDCATVLLEHLPVPGPGSLDSALDTLALLHSRFFLRSDELAAHGWLPRFDPLPWAEWARGFIQEVEAAFQRRDLPDVLLSALDAVALRDAAAICYATDAFAQSLREQPQTLAHGGFQPAHLGRRSAGEPALAFDWDGVRVTHLQQDLTALWAWAERQAPVPCAEADLLGGYLRRMEARTGLSLDAPSFHRGWRVARWFQELRGLDTWIEAHRSGARHAAPSAGDGRRRIRRLRRNPLL